MSFYDDLRSIDKDYHINILYDQKNSMFYVHTGQLMDTWIEWALTVGKGWSEISRDSIREEISYSHGFLSHNVPRRINGKNYKCTLFNINLVPPDIIKIIKRSKIEEESKKVNKS